MIYRLRAQTDWGSSLAVAIEDPKEALEGFRSLKAARIRAVIEGDNGKSMSEAELLDIIERGEGPSDTGKH